MAAFKDLKAVRVRQDRGRRIDGLMALRFNSKCRVANGASQLICKARRDMAAAAQWVREASKARLAAMVPGLAVAARRLVLIAGL